jgi:hypothetical protein
MLKTQIVKAAGAVLCAAFVTTGAAAARAQSVVMSRRHVSTLASMIPANGDVNPYAVVVAPVTAGKIRQGDVLVDNFNNVSNLQGTGGTIVDYNPSTRRTSLLAELPRSFAQCPGGIGLSTAMTMLKSGWIIVGSTPSKDGTTATKGPGCLLVFNADGALKAVWSGARVNDPWGNMAVVDNGSRATLFISMAGFGVPGPNQLDPASHQSIIVRRATVLRVQIAISPGSPPKVVGQTVVASGFGEQADKGVFLIGPTGLALIGSTLYVSDAVDNRIVAIPNATTRASSAGTGRTVTKDGLLQRPLALAATPNGHILACNGLNGQVVEFDPASGKQLAAQWVDSDQAQTPPGSGDLFGLAVAPSGVVYYVEDDTNMLAKAQ